MAASITKCCRRHRHILTAFIDGYPHLPLLQSQNPSVVTVPWRRCQSNALQVDFRRAHNVYQNPAEGRYGQEEQPASLPVQELKQETKVTLHSNPWYLQVHTPVMEHNTILERQQLPHLPPNPPALLQPLLDYVSVDLGLNDLTLLDLRHLDPPPALGANLLMVLGTARSEKHLHVSAERFCRWLKTTHQLIPSADGLIGRGELKLKLRRKMRRAKLLSRVGSSEIGSVDDGIRTGWICVNIRDVPDGTAAKIDQDLHKDYVGFGADVDKATLVVQILTQEKREDLDLEHLWGSPAGKEKDIISRQRQDPKFFWEKRNAYIRSTNHYNGPFCAILSASRQATYKAFGQMRLYHSESVVWSSNANVIESLHATIGPKMVRICNDKIP